jgi:predicted AlkP superfamily pyrophosphatase or phosphodiesterase
MRSAYIVESISNAPIAAAGHGLSAMGGTSNGMRITTLKFVAGRKLNARKNLLLCSMACLFALNLFSGQQGKSANSGLSPRPRLVLLLIADQFSYDYLSRLRDKLTPSGFRLLLDGGADFTNCQFRQAANQTASGQAIIATGAYPWANGIIADSWYDRHKEKVTTAIPSDETISLAGAMGQSGTSRQLNGTTIGDQLKLATNGRAKVYTISSNPVPALLMAGKLANAAFWWDTKSGNFVSSSAFGHELPDWARAFNDLHLSDRYFGKTWQRLGQEGQYASSTRDDYPHERPFPGDGNQFPHLVSGAATSPNENFYKVFAGTPWANQLIADFAKELIEKENLGLHSDPDFLCLNFSPTEALSNGFGPNSEETQDMVMRLDQTVSDLLQFVDKRSSLNNCLVVFTADHGVSPIPELLKERGFDAGRIDPKAVRAAISAALEARLGKGDWIDAFEPPNLYLNLRTIDRLKFRQPDVEALAAKSAHGINGVGEVYNAAQFFLNELPNGPLAQSARRSYYWGRSGELLILPKPGYIFTSESDGTASGSPYSADDQVPLILFGHSVKSGRYGTSASPADIAPTIASIIGISVPSCSEGRALAEAFSPVYGPMQVRTNYAFANENP